MHAAAAAAAAPAPAPAPADIAADCGRCATAQGIPRRTAAGSCRAPVDNCKTNTHVMMSKIERSTARANERVLGGRCGIRQIEAGAASRPCR